MRGWFGDLGRLSRGLLYWNARKALFRIRGASGAAPCQHPSDSGRAGETGCEACAGWSDVGRFRRLCPLLTRAADGRRVCSVDASGVRPFWGRALLFFGGAGAAAVVVAVLGAFAAFRAIGYRVPLRVVAWPPAWHRIDQARADYFYRMALAAFAAGDVRRSFLALGQVYVLDPGNTEAARLLAQFTQIADPEYSDAIYARLLQRKGTGFEETAEAWFRALLARGDFNGVAALSARMLREGAGHVPAWTEGLLFAERMGAATGDADRLLAGPAGIPDEARSVLEVARALRDGSDQERRKRVEVALGGDTTPFEVYFALRRIIDLGGGAEVATFLEGPEGAAVAPYDREALKLDAFSCLGWRELERKEIVSSLDQPAASAAAVLISGHLVRHPDPDSAGLVFELLDGRPLAATAADFGPHLALLCMAGVNGLEPRMRQQSEILGKILGGTFAASGRMREFFAERSARRTPASFLPALPQLPIEVVYALWERYPPPPAPASGPAAPQGPAGGDGRRGQ